MQNISKSIVLLVLLVACCSARKILINENHKDFSSPPKDTGFQVGVGKYDVTGPAAEINMMGYAMPGQRTAGIHTRLWSRAFVFVDAAGNRAVYVSNDLCMTMQSFKMEVITKLQSIYGPTMYTHDNVLLSGIHTHSGPGAYSWYALYDITSLGFSKESYDVVVEGIVQAIVKAHNNVKPAQLFWNLDELDGSNINRSPSAYLANPAEERALYPQGDTDKNMTVVRIVDANNGDMGSIAWFPVHCTSMNNTNHFISSDNKGYASYMFERYKNGNQTLFGDGAFVAAFGQANEGDVSPNTDGAKCPDGTSCAMNSSTCNGRNEQCIAFGPGKDMFESTQIIGSLQFKKALSLYESATSPITGTIKYRHMFVNMTNYQIVQNGTVVGHTCQAAMGYSFAAGTTDGPGAFNFTQGDNATSNPFWNLLASFLAKPTPEQIACQAPKPILLDVGQTHPYPWTPDVVPVQIIMIGNLVMCAVPGEFSTMSGRRLRNTVRSVFEAAGMNDLVIVVAGLSNTYTGYITTEEEYHVQRYEGASTIFGPNTLAAYQQLFTELATALVNDTPVPVGPTPRNLTGHLLSFIPPVILDTPPLFGHFGQVYLDVQNSYSVDDTVEVIFYGGNPRNNLMTGQTFLTVELMNADGSWTVILTDADWDTKFHWQQHDISQSLATIQWTISEGTAPGKYRIQHFGYYKGDPFTETVKPYNGQSSVFAVL